MALLSITYQKEFAMFLPTIHDACTALKPLEHIPRPESDNEGDTINADTVFPYLSPFHQEQVRHAEEILYDYTRTSDGQPNRRALNTLTRNGYPASLDPSQDNYELLRGRVKVGEWEIDISDPQSETDD
jgi:hypothetical protein